MADAVDSNPSLIQNKATNQEIPGVTFVYFTETKTDAVEQLFKIIQNKMLFVS